MSLLNMYPIHNDLITPFCYSCNEHEKIKLIIKINDRSNIYNFCSKNIKWFTLKVTGKSKHADLISHSPAECGLLHYNPKLFDNKKLCGYSLSKIPCPFGKKCNMIHPINFPQILKNDNLSEKVININNKTYNSAGVLIITQDNGFNYLNLFKSSTQVNRGNNIGEYYYGIAGGGINLKDKSVEDAAQRELFEESCKTLTISSNILNYLKDNNSYVEIIGKTLSGQRKPGLFACYVCNLDVIGNCIKSFYNINKNILSNSTSDIVYNETQDIDKFCYEDVLKEIYNMNYSEIKPMKFQNINGDYKFIDERSLKCIWKIINSDSTIIDNSIKLNQFELVDTDTTSTFYFSNNFS